MACAGGYESLGPAATGNAQRVLPAGEAGPDETPAGYEPDAARVTQVLLAEIALLDRIPDQAVLAALQSLPPESRLLVSLADVAGLGYQQIVRITGIPRDGVAAGLHRGRSQLRVRLAACGPAPASSNGGRQPDLCIRLNPRPLPAAEPSE